MDLKVSKRLAQLLAALDEGERFGPRSDVATKQRPARNFRCTLADLAANSSTTGTNIALNGRVLTLSTSSDASAQVEVSFDRPGQGDDRQWHPMRPGSAARKPDGKDFEQFWVRRQASVASNTKKVIFLIDPEPESPAFVESTPAPNVTVSGRGQVVIAALNAAGTEVDVIASNEGAVAISGFDGANYTRMSVDTSGRQVIVGAAAAGAAVAGNPLLMGVSDATNVRALRSDANGFLMSQGVAASGTAIGSAGFPYVVAGSDGANSRSLLVDTVGRVVIVGSQTNGGAMTAGVGLVVGGQDAAGTYRVLPVNSNGSAAFTVGLQVSGTDGTNAQVLAVDTSGRVKCVGGAADGAAVAGNPVLVAGVAGGNAKTLQQDANNQLIVIGGSAYRLLVQSQGAQANTTLWNAAAVGIAGKSAAITAWGLRRIEIIGNTSAATTLTVEYSADGSTWYVATAGTAAGQTPSVAANGNFSLAIETGAPYVRLSSSAAATITAIALAKS